MQAPERPVRRRAMRGRHGRQAHTPPLVPRANIRSRQKTIMKKAAQGTTYGPSGRWPACPAHKEVSKYYTSQSVAGYRMALSGPDSHWKAIGLPADRTATLRDGRMRAFPRFPMAPGKALHPSQGLCMFNLTSGATPVSTDRTKSSRLFVREEGRNVHTCISQPSVVRRTLADQTLPTVKVMLQMDA